MDDFLEFKLAIPEIGKLFSEVRCNKLELIMTITTSGAH